MSTRIAGREFKDAVWCKTWVGIMLLRIMRKSLLLPSISGNNDLIKTQVLRDYILNSANTPFSVFFLLVRGGWCWCSKEISFYGLHAPGSQLRIMSFFFFFFSLLTVQQVLSVVLYEISSRLNMFCISIMTNIYLQIYISHSNVYKEFMKPRIG